MEMLTQKYKFSYVLKHKDRAIHISCLLYILLFAAKYTMNRFSYYSAYLTTPQLPILFQHCFLLEKAGTSVLQLQIWRVTFDIAQYIVT
jgi:hypothetical protein